MMKPTDQNIASLFEPRSIAVVGASADKGKIGHSVIFNMLRYGYKGRIFPINPKAGEIEGIRAYKSILDVNEQIDVAVVTIPAKFAVESVKECAAKGVKYGLVITSGFSEVGNVAEERKMVAIANQSGMRILGPNIFGIFSAECSLNCTFAPGAIPSGNLGIGRGDDCAGERR